MLTQRKLEHQESLLSLQTRRERWQQKLESSPFTADLFTERLLAVQKANERDRRLKHRQMLQQHNEMQSHNEAFKTAVSYVSPYDHLRSEKRSLVLQERHLAARRDTERTAVRVARLERERQRQALQREEAILEREYLK